MRYMALDIETGAATIAALSNDLSRCKPNANTKDPAKRVEQVKRKQQSVIEKSALTNAAPIMCIGLKDNDSISIFTAYDFAGSEKIINAGINLVIGDSEIDILHNVTNYITHEKYMGYDLIVTFNGRGFDLPKIRLAYARNGLSDYMPEVFRPNFPHIDLMIEYCKYYSVGNKMFCSFEDACIDLGIIETGKAFSGGLFHELVNEGKEFEATIYNGLDCLLTEQMYFKMF